MPTKIITLDNQAKSQISNGAIMENRPIGFSNDSKSVKPYSNIYYWSRLWTDVGGTISDHPHKGFDIFTYVIKGQVDQIDSEDRKIRHIHAGDSYLIVSGSGVVHSEKYHKNTELFQIWFDPNLRESLGKKAFYKFVKSEEFPFKEIPGITREFIIGNNSPYDFDDLGISITDYKITPGLKNIKIKEDYYYSAYILKGEIEIAGKIIKTNDYFIIKNEKFIEFYSNAHSRIYIIESPIHPKYKTYLQLKSNNLSK